MPRAGAIEAASPRSLRAQLLTVPVLFIGLLKQQDLPFAVYPSRRDPTGWCFKFQRRFVLEMDAEGRTQWLCVEPVIRGRVEAALERAVELHGRRGRSRPRQRVRPPAPHSPDAAEQAARQGLGWPVGGPFPHAPDAAIEARSALAEEGAGTGQKTLRNARRTVRPSGSNWRGSYPAKGWPASSVTD